MQSVLGKGVVLVVDDFPESVDPLMAMLDDEGFVVRLAVSAEMALAQADLLRPDVIVMDFAMPQMNGIEAVRLLKATPGTRHIPVLLFSAHAGPELGSTATQAGCSAVFKKPAGTRDIVGRILELCSQAVPEA